MGMHHMIGCRLRDLEADGFTLISGSASYVDAGAAEGGYVLNCGNDILRGPFYVDGTITECPSSGTIYEWSARYYQNVNTGTNDEVRFGTARSGTQGICISIEDTTNNLTLRVGNVLRANSGVALPILEWKTVQVTVDHQVGGDVNVYINGNRSTPIITYTLIAADITNMVGLPNEWYIDGHPSGFQMHSLIILDPADLIAPISFDDFVNPIVRAYIPTGNGTYTGMTGTYTDVDEIPYNDTDVIEATAAAQQSTFSHAASSAALVGGVMVAARIQRGDTSAGSNMRFIQDDGTLATNPTQAAPGDGHVFGRFKQRRDGTDFGDPTDIGSFNDTDYGVESVT